jgi:hypothetical protein
MCHLRYELGFYMPEDDILHSQHCGNLKSYMLWGVRTLQVHQAKTSCSMITHLEHVNGA